MIMVRLTPTRLVRLPTPAQVVIIVIQFVAVRQCPRLIAVTAMLAVAVKPAIALALMSLAYLALTQPAIIVI